MSKRVLKLESSNCVTPRTMENPRADDNRENTSATRTPQTNAFGEVLNKRISNEENQKYEKYKKKVR